MILIVAVAVAVVHVVVFDSFFANANGYGGLGDGFFRCDVAEYIFRSFT